MTGIVPENFVEVIAEDRSMACVLLIPSRAPEQYRSAIMAGEWDRTTEVQILARHRIDTFARARFAAPGWRLTPIEPTSLMIMAGASKSVEDDRTIRCIWDEMMGEVPEAPTKWTEAVVERVARGILRDRCIRYPQQEYPESLEAWIDQYWKVCEQDARAALAAICGFARVDG